ncbi:hypothetical protein ACE3MS_22020 [Paenibacillus dendritiformis]|uniref:DUF1232 domain-containing protein n=1 Tax=Paenibacillus dendritiformis C454 TaxID=1131935 RepID=H3SMJ5_9BACL|nr:hypothetical protein [Paenibacillus dendritiformis]EHQ59711.1 hypothetical protein PDENDC454_23943 [Paenibacillus dendritiformis C454]CAH8772129.1 hypothetical protein H7S4_004867 [Paenibacillus dendritiformis]
MGRNHMSSKGGSRHPVRRIIRLFRSAPRLLFSTRVPLKEKGIFVGLVLLYWVMPDVMPFMPIDDILFTMILMPWFSKRVMKYDPVR